VGVRYILDHPLSSIKTNVEGTDLLLESCARRRRKVLLASTSEVYGKNEADALCETADSLLGPASVRRWSYATAKKLDEFLALAYRAEYGLPVVITRFFNIVGPRQAGRYGMVLPSFIRAALAGRPIRVFGDGCQTRNFTYIDDCIDAFEDMRRRVPCICKIQRLTGWSPAMGIDQMIRATAFYELRRVPRPSPAGLPALHLIAES
jgi:UDP-glucose 4-epimerase